MGWRMSEFHSCIVEAVIHSLDFNYTLGMYYTIGMIYKQTCSPFLHVTSISILPFHLQTGVNVPVLTLVNCFPCSSNWLGILYNHSEKKSSLSSNMHSFIISKIQQKLALQLKTALTPSLCCSFLPKHVSCLSLTRRMLPCSDLDLVTDLC